MELSPSVYIALCGLVQDALEHPSDAMPLLKRVEHELGKAKSAANAFGPDDELEQAVRPRVAAAG